MIKNILFDFGVVLYDVSPDLTHQAFSSLGIKDANSIFTIQKQHTLCDQFEKGEIDEYTFFSELQELTSPRATIEQIKAAWQSMLIGLTKEKFNLLKKLRRRYRLKVLSNTNSAHYEKINDTLQLDYGLNSMQELFDNTYLSFQIGHRKPDVDAFNYVLENAGIEPRETLFVDDLEANIEAAKKIGMDALLYKPGKNLSACLAEKLEDHGCSLK